MANLSTKKKSDPEADKSSKVDRLVRVAREAEAGERVDITELSDQDYLERLLAR